MNLVEEYMVSRPARLLIYCCNKKLTTTKNTNELMARLSTNGKSILKRTYPVPLTDIKDLRMNLATLYEISGLRKLSGPARFGLLALTMGLASFSQTLTSDGQYTLGPVTGAVGVVHITTGNSPNFTNNDYWVADHLRGFCRFSRSTVGGPFVISPATCLTGGPVAVGKPHYDAANRFLYIPDLSAASLGVWRYTYTAASRTFGSPVRIAATLRNLRPHTVALGPDGSLYVGTLRNANIYRVTNPDQATTAQVVSIVGSTNDGVTPQDIAFAGQNLWIAQSASIARIPAISTCTSTARCTAEATNTAVTAPTSITALSATRIVFGDSTAGAGFIYNYDTTTDTQSLWSQTMLPAGATAAISYPGITGISKDAAGIIIAADIVGNITALQGGVYSLSALAPLAATGAAGVPPTPALAPGLVSANFAYEGVTLPAGAVVLGGTLANKSVWISDHVFGLCRLDPVANSNPIRYTLNATTCVINAVSPGQPVKSGTTIVFVPDNSSASTGVWRYTYNTATKLLGSPVRLGASAFNGARPTALALNAAGDLFVGSTTTPLIRKIKAAATATAAATTGAANVALNVPIVGRMADGNGVTSFALSGTSLYIGQATTGLQVLNTSGLADGVQTQTLPIAAALDVLDAQALLVPTAGKLIAASTLGVYKLDLDAGTQALLASKGVGRIPGLTEQLFTISGLGLNIAGDLVIGDDPYLGNFAAFGRLWTIPAANLQ